jgi:hypothetical protein
MESASREELLRFRFAEFFPEEARELRMAAAWIPPALDVSHEFIAHMLTERLALWLLGRQIGYFADESIITSRVGDSAPERMSSKAERAIPTTLADSIRSLYSPDIDNGALNAAFQTALMISGQFNDPQILTLSAYLSGEHNVFESSRARPDNATIWSLLSHPSDPALLTPHSFDIWSKRPIKAVLDGQLSAELGDDTKLSDSRFRYSRTRR